MTRARIRPRVEQVMGTAIGVTVVDEDTSGAVDEVFGWLRWVDEVFSTYRLDSEISRLDRGEMSLDDANRAVRHILARCDELEDATRGRFSANRPGEDRDTLDPSGLVKGWSIDEAAMILHLHGLDRFMINAGGDILCAGTPPVGERWPIGIRHPLEPMEAAAVVSIPSGAVATSGTYERGDHIWNADGTRLLSATVVGPDLGTTDALATAVFAEPEDLSWMDAFPGYELVLIGDDRRVRWTAGLDDAISLEPEGL